MNARVKAMNAAQLRDAIERIRGKVAGNASELAQDIEAILLNYHGIEPLVPCPGAAHRNPHIDHCMVCAPRWGWVEQTVFEPL